MVDNFYFKISKIFNYYLLSIKYKLQINSFMIKPKYIVNYNVNFKRLGFNSNSIRTHTLEIA